MAPIIVHDPLDIVLVVREINEYVFGFSEKVTVFPQFGNYVVVNGTEEG